MGNLVICLQEQQASPENVAHIASQIRQLIQDVLGIESQVGTSYFPSDGLIHQDLLKVSMQDAHKATLALPQGSAEQVNTVPRDVRKPLWYSVPNTTPVEKPS